MKLTKQQKLEKILSIIHIYKSLKKEVLSTKCRHYTNTSNIYYYESKKQKGLFITCSRCKERSISFYKAFLTFKLSLQDRFLLEVLL